MLTEMAIGAAVGAVGGIFVLKDKDIPIWGKALMGAAIGATGGLAGGFIRDMVSDLGTNVVESATKNLPVADHPISFTGTGFYAGRTEKQWLEQAAKHAGIEAKTEVNQAGYIRECINNAKKAAKP